MAVLIACEESQAICCAFRSLGIEAYSCDIKPCSGVLIVQRLSLVLRKRLLISGIFTVSLNLS